MDYTLRDRVLKEANIFLKYKTTVRGVSKRMGVSKSTVHKDFIEKLKDIDVDMYNSVLELLKYNKEVRHIRGGQATKEVYSKLKKKSS